MRQATSSLSQTLRLSYHRGMKYTLLAVLVAIVFIAACTTHVQVAGRSISHTHTGNTEDNSSGSQGKHPVTSAPKEK